MLPLSFVNYEVARYKSARNRLPPAKIGVSGTLPELYNRPHRQVAQVGAEDWLASSGIPRDYASLPNTDNNGADLLQDFSALAPGNYTLSFYVQNQTKLGGLFGPTSLGIPVTTLETSSASPAQVNAAHHRLKPSLQADPL